MNRVWISRKIYCVEHAAYEQDAAYGSWKCMRSPYPLQDEMHMNSYDFKHKEEELDFSGEQRKYFRRAEYNPLKWALKATLRKAIRGVNFMRQPYDRVNPDHAIRFSDDDPDEAHAARAVRELNLDQKDLRTLRERFSAIDTDLSGEIDYGEFLHLVREQVDFLM